MKIVRNDITKMNTEAIVNTANEFPIIGDGCDRAIYEAAGKEQLLKLRKEIGHIEISSAFVTPGFNLPNKYIIHTVSPKYIDGNSGEEEQLRLAYKNALNEVSKLGIKSVAFPLISSGSFGFPKVIALRIAADEINAFCLTHSDVEVTIVVFDSESSTLGQSIDSGLKSYIDSHYVEQKIQQEYLFRPSCVSPQTGGSHSSKKRTFGNLFRSKESLPVDDEVRDESIEAMPLALAPMDASLSTRLEHLTDTFSQYLLFLIESRGYKNSDVYKAACVDKKVFSKIKNNPDYHTEKITALCLCVGCRLSLDETRDLLGRAGYALSPCIKTDVIFSYFIENEIYDMVEIDIALEENGEKCIIS